jgi:hypothetical protein
MAMIVVAGIGIAINALTAMLFLKGQEDINIRGAYLHMAADALVSLGVVVAGLAIVLTGLWWIDPLVSLVIIAVIAWGTWGLARDSLTMGLLAAPARIDLAEVKQHLASFDGVSAVHDLHVWPMSTTEVALTAHLVMPGRPAADSFLRDIAASLETRFAWAMRRFRWKAARTPVEAVADGRASPTRIGRSARSAARCHGAAGERRSGGAGRNLSRHAGEAVGITLRILGDRKEAEDALQDVYVNLWQRPTAMTRPARARSRGWRRLPATGRLTGCAPARCAAALCRLRKPRRSPMRPRSPIC